MAGFDECCCGRTDHLTDGGGRRQQKACAQNYACENPDLRTAALLRKQEPPRSVHALPKGARSILPRLKSQVFAVRAGEDRRRAEAEHQEQAAHHEHRVHGRQGDLADHGAGGVNYGHARDVAKANALLGEREHSRYEGLRRDDRRRGREADQRVEETSWGHHSITWSARPQERRWDCQTERLGGLHVDDQRAGRSIGAGREP